MDNLKTPKYYLEKVKSDIEFCIANVKDKSETEFSNDEPLTSAISFKFVQISKNVKKLPEYIFEKYQYVP